jgi:predicted nucleic acid-binding protein
VIAYYLDSSALIKRYVAEAGSDWLEAVVFAADDALPLASRVTMVEVWSALARRRREASISPEYHADALAAFREDCQDLYRFIEFEETVYELAGSLLERHVLRAYDAVQLASALVAAQVLTEASLPQPIFLSADDRLLQAASAEGLPIDNPNHFQ